MDSRIVAGTYGLWGYIVMREGMLDIMPRANINDEFKLAFYMRDYEFADILKRDESYEYFTKLVVKYFEEENSPL